MSHKGLTTDSVDCLTERLIELLNDARYQEIDFLYKQEYLSIQGNLKSYHSLQVLLTAINQLDSSQQDRSIHVKVTIGSEQHLFETSFAKQEYNNDPQLTESVY